MFLSSYENKIDKKGRVSVPATFRSHLNSMGYNGFIGYPSFNHAALEACSQDELKNYLIQLTFLIHLKKKEIFCHIYSYRRVKIYNLIPREEFDI